MRKLSALPVSQSPELWYSHSHWSFLLWCGSSNGGWKAEPHLYGQPIHTLTKQRKYFFISQVVKGLYYSVAIVCRSVNDIWNGKFQPTRQRAVQRVFQLQLHCDTRLHSERIHQWPFPVLQKEKLSCVMYQCKALQLTQERTSKSNSLKVPQISRDSARITISTMDRNRGWT